MFSTLPKLADKEFIVGFFLPALLAAFAIAWAFPDAAALEPLRALATTDKQLSDLAYLVLGVWLAAVLLMTANYTLFRVLEGYLPPVSWLVPLRAWHRRRFRTLLSRHDAIMTEWEEAQQDGQHFPDTKQAELARLRLKLLSRYPTSEAEVMPTAFGNTIRAFEVYPRQIYGADAIPVWLRLVSVVQKEYAAQVNGARAQVDCFVNIAWLAFSIALAALGRAVMYAIGLAGNAAAARAGPEVASGSGATHWILAAAIGFAVSVLAYRWAVARAAAWGEVVKGAFDCYLPTLIKQLGYAMPPTEAERRAFWEQFNARVLYQYPMPREWPPVDKVDAQGEPLARAAEDGTAREDGEAP